MLSYISGTIKACQEQKIIVDIGIGALSLQVPNEQAFQLETKTTIHTHLHWHQEQGPTLFGFQTELDRTVFLLIISCSGLGPKIGLAVLAHLGSRVFLEAVSSNNEATLSKVSGIGQKKAEQMIIQLRHKVANLIKTGVEIDKGSYEHWHNVSEVLTSLHYSRSEIAQTMKHLGETYADQSIPFDQLIRHALSFLSKRP